MAPRRHPPTHRKSLKHCIRSFTPSWFSIIMGTGIVSILAARFHFGRGTFVLEVITLVFFLLNLGLYVIFIFISILRYSMFPGTWTKMISNPGESLFLGAFPIGTASLIDAALIMNQTYRFEGKAFTYSLWGFWWFDLAVSYVIAFGIFYNMMSARHHLIKEMTPLWVLPVLSLVAASATGGNMSQALLPRSITLATLTTVFSLATFVIGISLSLMITSFYLVRLLLHGPPSPQIAVAGFIAASPLGQGGFSLLSNGRTLSIIFPGFLTGTFPRIELAGQILYGICFCASFILWSMGLCWIMISIFAIIVVRVGDRVPFKLTYWGAVFPNGVFALCTVQLSVVLDNPFFNYFGVVWSGITLLLWTICFVQTVIHTCNMSIFPPDTRAEVERVRIRFRHDIESFPPPPIN